MRAPGTAGPRWSVAVVVIALLLFTPALRYVPQAVLAAIVLVAVVNLLKPRRFAHLWRVSRVEATIAGVTFLITLATAPRLYWGVLAGVLMGLTHFLHHRLHPVSYTHLTLPTSDLV